MEYPADFPEDLKDEVEIAFSDAEAEFSAYGGYSNLDMTILVGRMRTYCVKIFAAFAEACCKARERRLWNGETFRREYDAYLYSLTRWAFQRKCPDPFYSNSAQTIEQLHKDVRADYQCSQEWRNIQTRLKAVATTPRPAASAVPISNTRAELRNSFVLPKLKALGLSKAKWATNAGVDPAVVYGYLDGTSNPRADSRKALAEELKIDPEQLPE